MCVVDCAALICASNAGDKDDPRIDIVGGKYAGVTCVGLMY